jgi:type VI secretion system protein ImpH
VSTDATTPAERRARHRTALAGALATDGTTFEFVQAMRLLMRLYPKRAAIGGWDDPAREVVRLAVPPSLAFPPSEIARLDLPPGAVDAPDASTATQPARMSVRFLGLTGPQGVLPHLYTEHAATRTRAKDTAFRDFLDLFHHRALSLFYRAWERYRTTVTAERGGEDRLRAHLLDFVGVGTSGVQRASAVDMDTLAFFSGLFALRSRPALGLAQLVGSAFEVPASVEQFVGQWQSLRHGGQLNVGSETDDGQLGFGVVGDAVFDPMARVRLRLGPLTRAQFDSFLPGGSSHARLRELARLYVDDQVGVEVQLVLARAHVPATQLGVATAGDASAPASTPPTLGFGSWLRARPRRDDADDVRLTLC